MSRLSTGTEVHQNQLGFADINAKFCLNCDFSSLKTITVGVLQPHSCVVFPFVEKYEIVSGRYQGKIFRPTIFKKSVQNLLFANCKIQQVQGNDIIIRIRRIKPHLSRA